MHIACGRAECAEGADRIRCARLNNCYPLHPCEHFSWFADGYVCTYWWHARACVYSHACVYLYMRLYVYVCECMYLWVYLHVFVRVYVSVRVCVRVYTRVCMSVCTGVFTCSCKCRHEYVFELTYMSMYVNLNILNTHIYTCVYWYSQSHHPPTNIYKHQYTHTNTGTPKKKKEVSHKRTTHSISHTRRGKFLVAANWTGDDMSLIKFSCLFQKSHELRVLQRKDNLKTCEQILKLRHPLLYGISLYLWNTQTNMESRC